MPPSPPRRWWRHGRARRTGVVLLVVGLLVVAASVRLVVLDVVRVEGSSMSPTLPQGSWLLVDRLAEPQVGDMVVFSRPDDWTGSPGHAVLVKRVVAVGGQRISCCSREGEPLSIDGEPHAEPYLTADARSSTGSMSVVVPEGRFFVLGDDRCCSIDSRDHLTTAARGTIGPDDVRGVVIASW